MSELHYQFFDVHRDRLMDEAARERLVRALPRSPAWRCVLCLRLGTWMVGAGQRLQDSARRQIVNQSALP